MPFVVAYVGLGPTDPTPDWKNLNYRTFGDVYRNRPPASRFAVLKHVLVSGRSVEYHLIDLLEVQLNDDWETFTIPPEAKRVFPTLDAALMSASINL